MATVFLASGAGGAQNAVSPLVVSDDADGLVGVGRPGDWPLRHNLPQCEDVRAGVRQVPVVLKYAGLVSEVRRFGKWRVYCTETKRQTSFTH